VQNFTLANGEQLLDLSIKLNPTTVSGTVVDGDTGDPVEGVTVTLAGQTATTDANGEFLFTLPPSGKQTLTFTKDRYGDRNNPGNDVQVVDFNVKEGKDNVVTPDVQIWATTIVGEVVDSSTGLGVKAQVSLDGAPPVDTKANGKFEFALVAPDVAHSITASLENYSSTTVNVTVQKGDQKNAGKIEIDPTLIVVTVTDGGVANPGVTVRLLKADGSVEAELVTDAAGQVTFGPTAPGDRDIELEEAPAAEKTETLKNVTLGDTNNYTVTYP
jgi:hypothetical protein